MFFSCVSPPILPSKKTKSTSVRVLTQALMAQMVSVGVRKLPEVRSQCLLFAAHKEKLGNMSCDLKDKYEFKRSQIKNTHWLISVWLVVRRTLSYGTCRIQPEVPLCSTGRGFPVRVWAFTLGKVVGFGLHCPHIRQRWRIKLRNGSSYKSDPSLFSSQQTDRTDQMCQWKGSFGSILKWPIFLFFSQ